MRLSLKQCLLLNNLMYLEPEEGPFPDYAVFTGMRVRDWMNAIDLSQVADADPDKPRMTTAEEWKKLIRAVRRDQDVMDLKILTTYTDLSEGSGASKSAVFLTKDETEAAVVYKGTDLVAGSAQWKDNFYSGNTADTPHQLKALRWFRKTVIELDLERYYITVTGHSKGGNKAKYITLLDDSADRCLSFDGEGFSDKFFRKYAVQIAMRSSLIENHIVNYDYISLLLNDIGSAVYYCGNNIGIGGFLENHLPNTFMRYEDNGDFHMDVDENGRPAEMMALDEFVNSFLRSLKDDERTEALMVLNDLMNAVMTAGKSAQDTDIFKAVTDLAHDVANRRYLAYLSAYLIRLEQKYPAMTELLASVLTRFGMEGFVRYVDQFAGIIHWKKQILWMSLDFDKLASAVSALNSHAPSWVYQKLAKDMEKKGIKLSAVQIRILADLIEMADSFRKSLVICEDGIDRRIAYGTEEI